MRLVLFLLLCTVVSACVSPEERLVQNRETCRAMGFTPGSEQHANCMLRLEIAQRSHHGHR